MMGSDFDRRFDETRQKAAAARQQSDQRQTRIDEMLGQAAQKCSETIRSIMQTDARLAGAFSQDITKIPSYEGNTFNCRFLGNRVNVLIWGTVTYDPRLNAAPSHQDPLWVAFVVDGNVQANAKDKRSVVFPLEVQFNVSGDVTMNLASLVEAAAQEVAAQ